MIRDEILEREIERTNKLKSDVDELATREQPSRIMQAWGNLVSTYLNLPGLRALWPMSSSNESGNIFDISGQGRTLTRSVVTNQYLGIVPTTFYIASGSRYLSRADEAGLRITGAETDKSTTVQGLTLGGWFRPMIAGDGLLQYYSGKYNSTGNQRSYALAKSTANELVFIISGDGIATVSVRLPMIDWDVWHFFVGRFIPSTSLDVFVNGTWLSDTTSIPASIFASTANYNIGAVNNGTASFANMYASIQFLSAMQLSDDIISGLWHQGRKLFGV
jgi:hypothetical protein